MNKHYGIASQFKSNNVNLRVQEDITFNGYSIVENILDNETVKAIRKKCLYLNKKQNFLYDQKKIKAIGENNQIRLPFVKDQIFLKILTNRKLKSILDTLFKPTESFYVLNQQNVIINQGNQKHNQSNWHRDFPYINSVSNIKQAFSVLITLNNFTENNGGTRLIPSTHLHTRLPSWDFIEKNQVNVKCAAGSAIIFDSHIFHAAGINRTKKSRIAINHVFSNPTYRQQILIPDAMKEAKISKPKSKYLNKLLGFESMSLRSDEEFKNERAKRKI